MDARQLLDQLREEKAELEVGIAVLERRMGQHSAPVRLGGNRNSKRTPKGHGRTWTPQMRSAMSKRVKAALAAKQKARAARSKAAKARHAKKTAAPKAAA